MIEILFLTTVIFGITALCLFKRVSELKKDNQSLTKWNRELAKDNRELEARIERAREYVGRAIDRCEQVAKPVEVEEEWPDTLMIG